jgi:hypothetical protein
MFRNLEYVKIFCSFKSDDGKFKINIRKNIYKTRLFFILFFISQFLFLFLFFEALIDCF